jgi:hypothetical protein
VPKLSAVVSAAAALAVWILLLGAATGGAAATALSIQVKRPAVRVCTNTIGGLEVGVRWLGGPRRYRIRVYDPHGTIVLALSGLATRRWKEWALKPTLGGIYRTIYTLPGRTVRYRTQSLGCGG